MDYQVKARQQRIEELKQFLEQHKGKPLNLIIAMFSAETGLALKKIREYLTVLKVKGDNQ